MATSETQMTEEGQEMPRKKPRPPRQWERVYDPLREAIDQGKLLPGDPIPIERELMAQHGVSRNTVRTALQRLEAQGLITEPHGNLGRRVSRYRPLYWNLSRFEVGDRRDDPDTGTDEWAADMREQGRVPRQDVEVEKLKAPAQIASYLGVRPQTHLVRRRRIRYADDIPVSIADTWLPEDIAEMTCTYQGETIKPWWERHDVVLPEGIVAATGIRQVSAEDEIWVRMPTDEEAHVLQVSSAGTPVGEHVRVGIDDTGRRIRALISVFPGARLRLRYQLKYRQNRRKESTR